MTHFCQNSNKKRRAEIHQGFPNEILEHLVSPGVLGFNNDNPRTNTIYLAINNYGVQTPNQVISVTLTLLKIGE